MENRFMKLLVSLISVLFILNISTPSYADEPPVVQNTFNKIVFFGDSLSDNGNLYWADWGFMPKTPPYYEGHFSNGSVWSEYVSSYYAEKNTIDSSNYAIGGLTALFHNPIHGFLPYSLTFAYDTYIVRSVWRDRSHTLFVLWIGANDYLPGSDDPETLTTDVVANIKYVIEGLIYHGGQNFLVINLPDLSTTPFAKTNNMVDYLNNVTKTHNAKLAATIAELQNEYKDANIHLYDANNMFTQLLTNTAVYNEKYGTHLSVTDDSCWQGGYTLAQAKRNVATIARRLDQQMSMKTRLTSRLLAPNGENSNGIHADQNLDTSAFAEYIAQTPSLLETFNAGEDGKMCSNPDDYVFWDHIHPTRVVHKMLSASLIEYIDANYTILTQ